MINIIVATTVSSLMKTLAQATEALSSKNLAWAETQQERPAEEQGLTRPEREEEKRKSKEQEQEQVQNSTRLRSTKTRSQRPHRVLRPSTQASGAKAAAAAAAGQEEED